MIKRKRRVTIADVAEVAAVSAMTVSRVINNKTPIRPETRRRVLQVIRDLDYQPNHIAQSLTNSRTFTIGVIVVDIANPFFAEITAGIETVSWQNHYNVILCNTQEDPKRERQVLRMLEAKQVDGVIVCSTRLPDEALPPLLEMFPASLVFNRDIAADGAVVFMLADEAGTARLAAHLAAAGRERLGMIAGGSRSRSAQARIKGFRKAAPNPNPPLERIETAHIGTGFEAARRLLTRCPNLDGLVCHNDLAAVGAIEACKALGKSIPADIAVVGCDDIPLASLITPKLTTLRVDRRALGETMMRSLFDHIEGEASEQRHWIQHELIIRESAP